MGAWAELKKHQQTMARVDRTVARVLAEAEKVPEDRRTLFLDQVWRRLHAHLHGAPKPAPEPGVTEDTCATEAVGP